MLLPGDSQNFTLIRVKLHLPSMLPFRQGVEILLHLLSIILIGNHKVDHCVICKESYSSIHILRDVVDVVQEEARAKYRPLGDARHNRLILRGKSNYNYGLGSVTKETSYPVVSLSCYTVPLQLLK